MKIRFKQMLCLTLCLVLCFSITGCSNSKEKMYGDYVKSLIGINYLGANENYIKATGANQEDADALYEANAEMLANNIQAYYGVTITDAPELQSEYIELAKHIYSKVNYSIDKVYKGTDSYYVDVIIYPMDIFNQTAEDVSTYVDVFNVAVANGSYNEYTLSEYETIFSRGLIDILFEASLEMSYADPVTVTVQIIEENGTYRISDSDFLAIDKAIFNIN
ncbi:MAG: hypothetical protein J5962_04185 [Lachnospiraceae bacterium]|nr:hypothetical protein [Lachnospiraceae bacterium]